MNKKLRELLEKINSTKAQILALTNEGKIEEAKALKEGDLKDLQDEFDIIKDLMSDEPVNVATQANPAVNILPGTKPVETHDAVHEFAEAARRGFRSNLMQEGGQNGSNGGYTVPEDIQTQINQFKEANFSLRTLVNVAPVQTNKGARTYQTKTQAPGFQKVDEDGKIQEVAGPTFTRVPYVIEDYAGYIPVTNDLLKDTDANLTAVIVNWIGRNSLKTDNAEILAILQGKDETELDDWKGIKKEINVTLGQAYRSAAVIVTNDDGLNYLDTLEDLNHRPLLNPNPTEPNAVQLRVGATVVPIVVIPNDVLASDNIYAKTSDVALVDGKTYYTRTGSGTAESPYVYTAVANPVVGDIGTYYEVTHVKYPFIMGDLKEAVTIFDRQQTEIMSSNVASVTGYNAFEQDGTLFRAKVRADYKEVDEDAWVNGCIEVPVGE
jgi:HK97 family phage major capsid protein